MSPLARLFAGFGVVVVTVALAVVVPGRATAVGLGSEFLLNDTFTGAAGTSFLFGNDTDEVLAGDWNGDGIDTVAVRRGNTFYARNLNRSINFSGEPADLVFSYGNPDDQVLVGDWDGNGTDTLAVRRGNTFYVKNTIGTGVADRVFSYGNPGDLVLVGDWDGDGIDTLAVRRGSQYFMKNTLTSGVADSVILYGNPGDTVLVGRWSWSQPGDSLAVRRGDTYYLRNSLTSGRADLVFSYGNLDDTSFAGDWDGDGVDTLGVRRPYSYWWNRTSGVVPTFGDGSHRVLLEIPTGTYRATDVNASGCSWQVPSAMGGTTSGWGRRSIVTVQASDLSLDTSGCGTWQPVDQTYPATPQTWIQDGTWVVGHHIEPGTYQTDDLSGAACDFAILSDFSWQPGSYEYHVEVPHIVTIDASDAGFMTQGCGTWTRI